MGVNIMRPVLEEILHLAVPVSGRKLFVGGLVICQRLVAR